MSAPDPTTVKAKKRKKIKMPTPVNDLFIKWLEEWYVETATKGSKVQYAFGKALVSLKRYPLPLKSGKECLVLEHFGPGICTKLDRRLGEYKKENPGVLKLLPKRYPLPLKSGKECLVLEHFGPGICTKLDRRLGEYKKENPGAFPDDEEEPLPDSNSNDVVEVLSSPPAKKPNNNSPKKSTYKPAKNTVPFAVFVAMHENGLESSIDEIQLKIVVERLISKQYSNLCMDNLIKRGLVVENSNSDVFTLTNTGQKVAELVYAKYLLGKGRPDSQKSSDSNKIMSYNSRLTDFDIIPLGSSNSKNVKSEVINLDSEDDPASSASSSQNFKGEIINLDSQTSNQSSLTSSLCKTDSQSSWSTKSNPTDSQTSSKSESTGVWPPALLDILVVDNHETGARYTVPTETLEELIRLDVKYEVKGLKIGDFTWIAKDMYGNELVLPYIVERKRMDDFAQSIKDSRFQEQKFRLKKCGLKNLIYLVENYGSNMFLGLPLTSVLQAATNTEVIDGSYSLTSWNANVWMTLLRVSRTRDSKSRSSDSKSVASRI
ncbi:crossover junction endonuclease MUS81 [Diaphorina citri]|uniref:Crossover junction endonuclease MUS81 n=1 Tax=Diaphorina citri TaxID=121845 RepID=A0A3Q0JD96_DIACI|nr:crossover junction endonuclease MUS81 [Diaphorina citri]